MTSATFARTRRNVFAIGAFLCAASCGGKADLGHGDGPSHLPPPSGSGGMDGGDGASASEALVLFDKTFISSRGLAVDDQYLYFNVVNGHQSLQRCDKRNCAQTVRELIEVPAFDLQAAGARLAVMNSPVSMSGRLEIKAGTCQLPDCAKIDWIASGASGVTGWALDGVAIYLGLPEDQSIYRCSLPDCPGGFDTIYKGSFEAPLTFDDGYLYWRRSEVVQRVLRSNVVRTRVGGSGALEIAHLESAPSQLFGPDTKEQDQETRRASIVDVDSGWLYVQFDCSLGYPCNQEDAQLARWPLAGGTKETIGAVPEAVGGILAHGNELAWYGSMSSGELGAELFHCRAEACAATAQRLGRLAPGTAEGVPLAADDDFLYWIEQDESSPQGISLAQGGHSLGIGSLRRVAFAR
jgi:hypothetical protein